MSFDAFELERSILEVRYPPAFLHFDRAGALWTEMTGLWPNLKEVKSAPAQTVFMRERLQVVAEVRTARVVAYRPERSLEEFAQSAAVFFRTVVQHLEVKTLSRVGLRFLFYSKTTDAEEAARLVMGTKLLQSPSDRVFSIAGGRAMYPSYALKWQNESLGARIALEAEERSLEREPSWDLGETEPTRVESHGIKYDVDYYTVKPIEPEQWHVEEWVKNAVHHVRRDSPTLLER